MNFASIEKIADAVLFEGYILYPYRPSAIKNQQRWNFGALFPCTFAEAQTPHEAWSFHTEVLLEASPAAKIVARLRFLQIVASATEDPRGWDEGFARARTLEGLTVAELVNSVDLTLDLAQPSAAERDGVPPDFKAVPLLGQLTLRAEPLRGGLYRLSATLANQTPIAGHSETSRRTAQASAFNSAHLLLHVEGGGFVSLLDPQPEYQADAAACRNQGVFPVLAGEEGDRSRMLCSPIILYDYPQVAPESAGDFFDGTEMDEMLALRVLTLTDEEKAEMRHSDPHARAILQRTEMLPEDHLQKLHGAVRGMRPIDQQEPVAEAEIDGIVEAWNPFEERPPVQRVRVFGIDVRCGDRVRLWPQKKADIMDMAMQGKVAVIEAIEQDLEDNIQFAVVLDDDPGRDMGMLRQPGHRFFFSPEEVEPLGLEVP